MDAKTEELIAIRLLGRQGLFRKMGTTAVLITHSRKRYFSTFSWYTLTENFAVRHLPIADKILVLSAEGKLVQDGTYAELEAREGYVGRMISQGGRQVDGEEQIAVEKAVSAAVLKVKQGLTSAEMMDLTRRTGDTAVYKYYYKSIGLRNSLLFVVITLAYCFAYNFPRKYPHATPDCFEADVLSEVWLQRWTSAGGGELPLYVSVYVLLSTSALVLTFGVLWYACSLDVSLRLCLI